jgi:hypothetical protein
MTMRKAAGWLLGVGLVLGVSGRTAADDAKEIIERAIRAHAGTEAQLAQRRVCVSTSKGTLALPMMGNTPTTRETTFILPDRLKWSLQLSPPGQKVSFVIALDGLTGWRSMQGAADSMTPPEYDAVQDEAHFVWVCTLIPLKQRGYTLSPLPETQVNGQPAVGVKVEAGSRGAVQLYFDKQTALLVKGVYRSREGGREVTKESYFADYKDFNGLKQPTRQTVYTKGQKTEDWTYESYRFPGRIDPKEFQKP